MYFKVRYTKLYVGGHFCPNIVCFFITFLFYKVGLKIK